MLSPSFPGTPSTALRWKALAGPRGRLARDISWPQAAIAPCYSKNLGAPNSQLISRQGMVWLRCASLGKNSWVLHAFSTRQGGASRSPCKGLNLGFTPDDARTRVKRNRAAFLGATGAGKFKLAELRQIHSTLVYLVKRDRDGALQYLPCGYPHLPAADGTRPQGDALITNEPGILLSVRTADCVPVLLVDPERRAVAAIHAGWKGMLGGIAEKTVGEMMRLFGSHPTAMRAVIGPSIRACCYEVSEDLAAAFCGGFAEGERFVVQPPENQTGGPAYPPPFLSMAPPGHGPDEVGPRPHLDLAAAAHYQLRRARLASSRIYVLDFCTACRTDLFFSHRKEEGHTGRMMAVIGIRPRSKPSRP